MKPDLKSIEERWNKASLGPWSNGTGYEQSESGNYIRSETTGLIICAEQDGTDCILREEDAIFIANTKTDIPQLIDYIERLEKVKELADSLIDNMDNEHVNYTYEGLVRRLQEAINRCN